MKKAVLLLFSGMLAFAACDGSITIDLTPSDDTLKGESVDVNGLSGFNKLFVLNEGQMGVNNASLDMLRISDGNYITGVFKKMNPSESAGLGDVGNDIAVVGDEVWIAMNNSGIVEVLSAKDENQIAAIPVPMPRCLAFDDKYVYVSSWNGAVAVYGADWSVDAEKSKNPKGVVYRIDRDTKDLAGSVEVGYQPEGLAVYDGKLYVANSGGISSSMPPAYAYDRTVSVIDIASFKVTKSIDVEINLQKVYSDGSGNIYVNTFGNYYSVHSCLWRIKAADGSVAKVSDYASYCAIGGDTVYCIGNENEFDYYAPANWSTWKCRNGVKEAWNIQLDGTSPYALAALPDGYFAIADAGDYYNPGTVSLFFWNSKKWTVTAGVCPGHFALW